MVILVAVHLGKIFFPQDPHFSCHSSINMSVYPDFFPALPGLIVLSPPLPTQLGLTEQSKVVLKTSAKDHQEQTWQNQCNELIQQQDTPGNRAQQEKWEKTSFIKNLVTLDDSKEALRGTRSGSGLIAISEEVSTFLKKRRLTGD